MLRARRRLRAASTRCAAKAVLVLLYFGTSKASKLRIKHTCPRSPAPACGVDALCCEGWRDSATFVLVKQVKR